MEHTCSHTIFAGTGKCLGWDRGGGWGGGGGLTTPKSMAVSRAVARMGECARPMQNWFFLDSLCSHNIISLMSGLFLPSLLGELTTPKSIAVSSAVARMGECARPMQNSMT